MATPQTTYNRSFSRALNGTPYDTDDLRSDARINGESSAIPAGIAVAEHASTEGKASVLAAATDKVAGISINSFARDPDDLSGAQAIKASAGFNMLTRGALWVTTEQTVTLADPVYVRHTSDGGSNTQPGTFRKDADSGKARLLRGARWLKGASAGEVAALYFDAAAEASADKGDQVEIAFDQAQATADATSKFFKNRSDRNFLVESVNYVNPTGLAADPTNFFNIKVLKNGATTVANWSTETGQQGTLTADTWVAFVNAALANRLLAPSDTMELFADEGGNTTLPPGRLVVHGRYI